MYVKKLKRKYTLLQKTTGIVVTLLFVGLYIFGDVVYFGLQGIAQLDKQAKILTEITKTSEESAIKAKKKLPVYITLPGAKQIRAIVDDYSKTESIWMIVSKTRPISIDYVPSSIKIPDVLTRTDKSEAERSVRSDIEKPLVDMFSQAAAEGYNLMIGSGYRSAALQKIYFDSFANSAGIDAANQYVAHPGQSEHQTGLAVDITTVSRNCYLTECFADTSDGQWLAKNSYKFGFILRYPKGKETTTGYQYEPWHFRYVGIDLATAIYESGLTLDEVQPYLETADNTLRNNGAI